MKIIKMNNRDRASRRLYSYLLVGETTCKETPHFQWIYRKLSQIYKKTQVWPNGPKICARKTKTDFKDRAFIA